jgi:undecaprenyl-diphosphatase
VTAALATVIAAMAPWLRWPLRLYVGAVALSRLISGAHFPSDVVLGLALGYGSAVAALALLRRLTWLPARGPLAGPPPGASRAAGLMSARRELPAPGALDGLARGVGVAGGIALRATPGLRGLGRRAGPPAPGVDLDGGQPPGVTR